MKIVKGFNKEKDKHMKILASRLLVMCLAINPSFLKDSFGADYTVGKTKYSASGDRAFVPLLLNSIEISEYAISWQPHVGAYQSPNRANNLRFTYLENGFMAQRRAPINITDNWK